MSKNRSLEGIWSSVEPGARVFDPDALGPLSESARRYLEHAIAPGTPLASAVCLEMVGEIKLKKWVPFEAEQVIAWDRGFVWRATARVGLARIQGFDRLVDGRGEMRWKLIGIVPVMTAKGPDIDRSAAGRLAAESVWLPSVLASDDVEWDGERPASARIEHGGGEAVDVHLDVDASGRLDAVSLKRWGEVDPGAGFAYHDFGGVAEEERTFGGYTIPTRLRVGWHVGSDRFAPEGEFFRCRIKTAEFS
jgi:hypothetical protein